MGGEGGGRGGVGVDKITNPPIRCNSGMCLISHSSLCGLRNLSRSVGSSEYSIW